MEWNDFVRIYGNKDKNNWLERGVHLHWHSFRYTLPNSWHYFKPNYILHNSIILFETEVPQTKEFYIEAIKRWQEINLIG
jgi:hypothetical protein